MNKKGIFSFLDYNRMFSLLRRLEERLEDKHCRKVLQEAGIPVDIKPKGHPLTKVFK